MHRSLLDPHLDRSSGHRIRVNIIAVDPGGKGGIAFNKGGRISLKGFTKFTETDFLEAVRDYDPESTVAVVEAVPPYVGKAIPSSSSFKLGYNYGFEVGVLMALKFPLHLVKPQKWQAGLSGLAGLTGAPRKRQLKNHACRLYPHLKITLATADALLILDWWLNGRGSAKIL